MTTFCIVIAILFVARMVWHVVCKLQYYRSAYFKNTHKSYLSVMRDTGRRGEYLLYRELRSFEKNGARFLFNTYLPLSSERTTEADIIMIHSSGLFVFENKNYAGWIFGDPNGQNWTQCIHHRDGRGVRKEQFLNPIRQNDLHIRAIKKTIQEVCPIYSVIVFGNRCELKNLSESVTKDYTICRTSSVESFVTKIGAIHKCDISQDRVEKMYDSLLPHSQVSKEIKRTHVVNIHVIKSNY